MDLVELRERVCDLPEGVRRKVQIEALKIAHKLEEKTRTPLPPRESGIFIEYPSGVCTEFIFLTRRSREDWRAFRLGSWKCKPTWKDFAPPRDHMRRVGWRAMAWGLAAKILTKKKKMLKFTAVGSRRRTMIMDREYTKEDAARFVHDFARMYVAYFELA
jgi:hypothetical protein